MQNFTGPTWTVGDPDTKDCYVFGNEEVAKWFQQCRAIHRMTQGSQPLDGGYLFMTTEEREEALSKEPALERFIRKVYGSREFIQNVERYCFWLVDTEPADIRKSKILYERVSKVKEFRLNCKSTTTQKLADRPSLFNSNRQPSTNYLLIPRHSSSERQYVPMGYVSPEIIATDAVFVLPYATPYHFGILTSSTHMGWMRRVAGRLRMDYRYSNTLVYNTFVWPLSDPWQVKKIESTAQRILDVRAKYPSSSYADLYDEVSMPKDLRKAHLENDWAVLEAYGLPKDIDEEGIIMHMFRLYYEAIGEEMPQ